MNKGIGCSTCHGRVDQMPLMYKVNTLYMQWCVELPPQSGTNTFGRGIEVFNPDVRDSGAEPGRDRAEAGGRIQDSRA